MGVVRRNRFGEEEEISARKRRAVRWNRGRARASGRWVSVEKRRKETLGANTSGHGDRGFDGVLIDCRVQCVKIAVVPCNYTRRKSLGEVGPKSLGNAKPGNGRGAYAHTTRRPVFHPETEKNKNRSATSLAEGARQCEQKVRAVADRAGQHNNIQGGDSVDFRSFRLSFFFSFRYHFWIHTVPPWPINSNFHIGI